MENERCCGCENTTTLTVGFTVVTVAHFHWAPADTAHAQVGFAGDGCLGLPWGRAINGSKTSLVDGDKNKERMGFGESECLLREGSDRIRGRRAAFRLGA